MRLLLLITFIFGGVISLNAQKKLTLHATVGTGFYGFAKEKIIDYSQWSYRQRFNYPVKPGASGGLELAYALTPKWRLSTGVNYQFFLLKKRDTYEAYDNMGNIYFEGIITKDHQVHALQLPLRCSFFVLDKKNKLSIDLGFIASWLMFSKLHHFEDEQYQFKVNTSEQPVSFDKNIDFLVTTGLTFKPFKMLAFRLSYDYDLAENYLRRTFFDEDVWINDAFEMHTSGLELEIIYQLSGRGKKGL